MFLPTTRKELTLLGWNQPDIILVTGDSYIDSPFIGVAVIGKILMHHGFRVGIIAQPDLAGPDDIKRLGEPLLFWGVSGGSVDSMVANYTALKKKRKSDDYTPGGINNRRPDRAVIAYTNLIKRHFKPGRPVVLGGIEASLRRIAHYDFWSGKIRRSILFDAKADYLIFGMARESIVLLARALKEGRDPSGIRGLGYISKTPRYQEIPSFEDVSTDIHHYMKSFTVFYRNNDPVTAHGICQKHNDRYLILNPPEQYPSEKELDAVFDLEFERDLHPYYKKMGPVKALDTIRFSIPTHQGCYGECNFCAISVHQGRTVRSRSEQSIVKEALLLTRLKDFKGYILDLGGPTANMYGFECDKKMREGACPDRRCLFPKICPSLKPDHSRQVKLLRRLESISAIKKIFIGSGIRYDLISGDKTHGREYLAKLVKDHVSGQMKVAPEHAVDSVLCLMGKPGTDSLLQFKQQFDKLSRQAEKNQFLTYYFIAAHPGCTLSDMKALKQFSTEKLKMNPEQVQIFTPTPSTYSTLMYHTGLDPFSNQAIFVEKQNSGKSKQKEVITAKGKNKFRP